MLHTLSWDGGLLSRGEEGTAAPKVEGLDSALSEGTPHHSEGPPGEGSMKGNSSPESTNG